MSESWHVQSFDRSKTVHRGPCVESVHSSILVDVTKEVRHGTTRNRMNSLEAAPPHLLMQNVRDIRKRLMETEKTLNNLTKAQARLDTDDDLEEAGSVASSENFTSRPGIVDFRVSEVIDDDKESMQSGLATLPDSSYAGFERVQPPSSTPNRVHTRSRLPGLLELAEHRDLAQPESPRDRRPHREMDVDEDRQDVRGQVRFLKEANKKVLIQNQKLMNEVEKTSYELQSTRAKALIPQFEYGLEKTSYFDDLQSSIDMVRELSYELDEFRQSFPDLEDKILGLQAETEAQDKALRDTEERFEACQQEVVQSDRKLKESQQENDELRSGMHEERKLRRGLETQRDEALQNFIESQDTLEDYQCKMKDRLKKYESSEDHLRDSLSHANGEREELLERLSWFQSKVKSQQEEIRRLQSMEEMEESNRSDIEEQNNELRQQISKLTSRLTRLESDTETLDLLQRENTHLTSQVTTQHEQLSVCQQEIEESRTMLAQLEQLAQQVQLNYSSRNNSFSNDSGNFSIRGGDTTTGSLHKSGAAESGLTRTKGPSPPTVCGKNVVADLKMKLAMKDAEIQRLQTSLHARQASDQSGIIDSLRVDLSTVIEKNQRSAEQTQELDSMVTQMEGDRDRLLAQVRDLKRELMEKDTRASSFELRLNQRNEQLLDFQETINEKSLQMSKLESQLRQKSSQIDSLEERLQDKISQCTHQVARISELEGEVGAREEECQTLHKELHNKLQGESVVQEEGDRVQKLHQEQCRDYQKQLEIIHSRLESKSSQAHEWEKQVDTLRREAAEKNHRLQQTEFSLAQKQEELETVKRQSQNTLHQLESQSQEGTAQIQRLEAALNMCKTEITTYIEALEESKDLFDRELGHRDDKIKRQDRQLKILAHEHDVKSQECEKLEQQVLERESQLQSSLVRADDVQDMLTKAQKQVSTLEHQLLTGNAQWMSESEGMERKLIQACQDLEQSMTRTQQLTDSLRTVQEQKKQLASEIDLLEHQLHDEQDDNDAKSQRVAKLEKDVRDMRVQLEHKIELVTDFEEQLHKKNCDMEQQLQLVSDLDVEIKRLQDTYQDSLDKVCHLEKLLDKSQYESKAKDEMIEDMKDSLSTTQEELSARKKDVSELKKLLEDRQNELHDRVATVNQLDMTIKEQHKEMEQRIQRLDANVRKHETELHERTRQIADLDDKLQGTQSQLREKTLQYQQTEQLSSRIQMELQGKTAKLQELQTLVERQKMKLEEQKDENVEITQELRLTREQLQQQHADFMTTRRELAQANREQERCQRELEEVKCLTESKECDAARLAEELGAAKAREAESEKRINTEIDRLREEQDGLEKRHRDEIKTLREELSDYVEAHDILKSQLKDKNKQLGDMEQHYADQIDCAAQELDGINRDVEARRTDMDAANEEMILKDSEIARLQAKMSGLESTMAAMRLSTDTFNTSTVISVAPDNQSTSEGYPMTLNNGQGYSEHREAVLRSVQNNQLQSQNEEIGQQSEIQYGYNSNNNIRPEEELQTTENIEPSGPVRVLNFNDGDDKSSYNPVIHRPKPVLPNNSVKQTKDTAAPPSGSMDSGVQRAQRQNQSAFSRISKETKSNRRNSDKTFPGEKELEPVTAMTLYSQEAFLSESTDKDPEQCMKELQKRMRANELRQMDIDRQLQSLEDEEGEHVSDR